MTVNLERRKAMAYHMSLFELLSGEVRKNPRQHIILVEIVEEFFLFSTQQYLLHFNSYIKSQ
jgi:hypothetical protein